MARSANGRSRGRNPRQRGGQAPLWGIEIFARPESNRYLLIVGFLVRRRAEVTVITVGWLVFVQLDDVTPGLPGWMTPAQWALLIMAATFVVVLAIPVSRRYTVGRVRAVVTRHRMRACFRQTRTWTVNGRLPFLMWSRPSRVGERIRVWLPAGLSVKNLERIIDELATACWAREVRITPVRGQAALIVVDIVRHDPLGTWRPLTPPVIDHLDPDGRPTWLPSPEELHDPAPTGNSTPGYSTGSTTTPTVPPDTNTAATKAATAINGTAANGAKNNAQNNTRGTGSGAAADPPGVTGFGGVDVTDYV